jgi:hypothetical protein
MPALPVLPAGIINFAIPAQPQNPPTAADVVSSIEYFRNVEVAYSKNFFS